MQTKQNFIFDLVKLIEYWVSAVNIVSFNHCVGHLPRIKISFPLLSVCTELISTPKIIFLPTLLSGNENSIRVSNLIPLPPYKYLSGSAFLANLIPPNKQFFNVKTESKSCYHISDL